MKSRHLAWGVAALALLAIALPSAAPAGAAAAATLTGTLVSVSTATRTLAIRQDDGTQRLLRATPDSNLSRNGAAVNLAALALRDRVTVRFDRATSTVIALHANGPAVATVRGVLAAVDVGRKTISIVTLAGPRAFRTTGTTLLARNGRPASLADLRRGDAVLIHARPAAAGPAIANDIHCDGPEQDEVEGTLSAISGNDVTIAPAHGSPTTVHVNASTRILLCNGGCHAATLADLATGMRAESEFDPVSLIAERLVARIVGDELANVRGAITALDASAGTLTITPEHGAAVDLKADAKTRISLNEAPATLADLHTGNTAHAAYDATTKVAAKVEARTQVNQQRQVEGKVTAVGTDTLTITPEHGNPVMLHVDASTRIFKNGAAITLADVHIDDRAHAAYDAVTMLASVVLVQSSVPHLARVEGSVTAIAGSSISVTPEHGAPVVLSTDATTHFFKDGRPATLADVAVGDRVDAAYDSSTLLAALVLVHASHPQLARVEGSVTAISSSSITIAPEHNGTPVTLSIDATTRIKVHGHTGTAADIQVGDRAEAIYDAATMLAKAIEVGGGHDH